MVAEDDEAEEISAKPAKEKKPLEKKKEIPEGGLMKAVVREGDGEKSPILGDQVIFHCTTRTAEGVVVESTRIEYGGKGLPLRRVLGKSKMLLGWKEAIPSMQKGEIAMLKMIPELHYGDPDCKVAVRDDYPKNEVLFFEIELLDFMPVRVLADGCGITKQVLADGKSWETPRAPYEVKVWITGRELGKEPFLNCTEGEPFHFTFGKAEVPAGLEKGIGTMVKEEKAVLYISKPHILPACGIPDLPLEGEEFEFEVEVLQIMQVRDVLGDGGVIKRRIKDGRGDFPMDCPLEDSMLQIHYKGSLPAEGGRVFYDTRANNEGQPLEFSSGEGLVPEGLEASCRLMLPGEVALVNCQPQYAYDRFPRMENVPEGAQVLWEVELVGFEKFKDWTGLTFREIMVEVEKLKGTGNRLFKEGKYDLAKAKYEKLLRDFNHIHPHDDDEGRELLESKVYRKGELYIALQLNVAACFHNLHEYVKCIDLCSKVMEESPQHAKAYYRRGLAYTATGDFEEARADFNKMLTLDKSTEAAAKAAMAKLRKKEQETDIKARKQFKGLFDKKPGELSQEPENKVTPTERAAIQEILAQPVEDEKAGEEPKNQPAVSNQRSVMAAAKALWKRFSKRCSIL